MGRRLDIDSLLKSLQQAQAALDPLYIVSGDEPLLITEAMDGLRAAATRAGYAERTSLMLDARSDWSTVTAATQNISLFGDRRLIELKIPTGKPGKTGGEVLLKLAGMAQSGELADTLVLVSLPRLDKTTRTSKWAQGLMQCGTAIELANVERTDLPRWIQQRLARQNQQLDPATLEWMADKVEGNLLAAFQEIQKLALLYPEGKIDAADVERAVLNVARYDVFGLRDAMLAGQAAKALTILAGLRAEGEALPLVLWAVGDEIRIMARLALAQSLGRDLGSEMRNQRIFGTREQLVRQTLARVPHKAWPAAVQHAHDVDRLIKGLKVPGRLDDPWEEMGRLALRIAAGKPRAAH
jgi:DNA polymerase-3 subunit delta